jgi:hypothetical protein
MEISLVVGFFDGLHPQKADRRNQQQGRENLFTTVIAASIDTLSTRSVEWA